MKEIFPTVLISENANVGRNVTFGRNITIWGNATIGDNTIIESNVEIGNPTVSELKFANEVLNADKMISIFEYNKFITSQTHIGENSIIRSGTTIYSDVFIKENFDCAHDVKIRERCTIGENCYISIGTQLKTEVSIGNHVRLGGTIADRTVIGNNVSSFGHLTHSYKIPKGGLIEFGPIIEDEVTIGRLALIIGQIQIGKRAYISAGSIVRNNIQADSLVIYPKSRTYKRRIF